MDAPLYDLTIKTNAFDLLYVDPDFGKWQMLPMKMMSVDCRRSDGEPMMELPPGIMGACDRLLCFYPRTSSFELDMRTSPPTLR